MAPSTYASDLCLCATKADTFLKTILEALAGGTPVVAMTVGQIPEQVEEYLGWYEELTGR